MNEFVDQVVRGIFTDDKDLRPGSSNSDINPIHPVRTCSPNDWDRFWGKCTPFDKEEMRRVARRTIAAMREPTAEHLVAACRKAAEEQCRPIAIHRTDAADIWQAMIDAALA